VRKDAQGFGKVFRKTKIHNLILKKYLMDLRPYNLQPMAYNLILRRYYAV